MGEFEETDVGLVDVPAERDYVAEAKAMGYKEDFDGPDKLDPKEFVLRKPLYDEMKKLRKKTKELEVALRTQTQMQQQLVEKERAELLAQYKAAKVAAIEEGDARKVVEIDEEVERIKNTPVQKQGVNPDFAAWADKNDWYDSDPDTEDEMSVWANAVGLKEHRKNPNRPVSEIYEDISRKVREKFPHKFGNAKRTAPPAVSTSDTGRTVQKDDEAEIPKEYKPIFFTMWRSGAWGDMTQKEAAKKYAADIKKIQS